MVWYARQTLNEAIASHNLWRVRIPPTYKRVEEYVYTVNPEIMTIHRLSAHDWDNLHGLLAICAITKNCSVKTNWSEDGTYELSNLDMEAPLGALQATGLLEEVVHCKVLKWV